MKKLILALTIILTSCSPKLFDEAWLQEKSPEYFTVRFETTKGTFDIEAKREWSPLAVDRLYQLVKHNFYTDIALYRVVPNFVAQFGIHNNKEINQFWKRFKIDDEPVIEKNNAMTVSFARAGKKSRGTNLFINLKNNNNLDKIKYGGVKGFPVVAKVIAGQDVVKKFYNGYGDKLGMQQDSINSYGNDFIKRKYPETDFILNVYILED